MLAGLAARAQEGTPPQTGEGTLLLMGDAGGETTGRGEPI